ncbi:stage II sporulation protein P [Paenibacillus sacheonensis]|uniref:Stage II sporulation protein P n=1 Tax=Paenibacillus sacheonensis TaxID=742054 RepID=A0A7X5BYA1_9BACL|nr:stage II sporulation protein P [Paenibacillus sacheonensis]MBM7565615.1 stage II sporulation protein P [Paenibacillus sacheonensis]NBC69467.1 stage II sporulation protein P [Paenibacillus sacheonensis]
MKRVIMTLNIGKSSLRLRQLLVAGRTFALLSLGSMVLVLVVGIGMIVQQRASTSPVSSMKGFAASVSNGLFSDMLAMELPGTAKADVKPSISGHQIGSFLVRLLTDINPDDPKSLLASQYPGLEGDKTTLLQGGTGTDAAVQPEDHESIPGSGDGADGPDGLSDADRPDHDPGDTGTVGEGDDTDAPDDGQGDTGNSGNTGTNGDTGSADPDKPVPSNPAKPTTNGRNVVFIYHSHARESWFPEISNKKTPESSTKNITLVGKRLADQLEKLGIGAAHSSTDYPTAIKNYNWNLSYKYSKQTVLSALKANKDLKFFFDIHRDSQGHKETTVTIDGQEYAQIFLIIGHANPNWEENEAFASQIHDALEKKYPGLSRGIWAKTTASGNGEYNQSLAPDSVLIEVGGVESTLAESYRTIDALAKVVSDIYWKDEKVTAPLNQTKK